MNEPQTRRELGLMGIFNHQMRFDVENPLTVVGCGRGPKSGCDLISWLAHQMTVR
jgi:hypothetical protein